MSLKEELNVELEDVNCDRIRDKVVVLLSDFEKNGLRIKGMFRGKVHIELPEDLFVGGTANTLKSEDGLAFYVANLLMSLYENFSDTSGRLIETKTMAGEEKKMLVIRV